VIINIDKRSGKIVDVNQTYDPRFYENREVPDGTLPNKLAGANYIFDFDTRTIKLAPPPREVGGRFVRLNKDIPFSPLHTHPRAQLIYVLNGSVLVSGVTVTIGQSHIIPGGLEHQIVGNEDQTVFINIHL